MLRLVHMLYLYILYSLVHMPLLYFLSDEGETSMAHLSLPPARNVEFLTVCSAL
jgi:hypothetical protein